MKDDIQHLASKLCDGESLDVYDEPEGLMGRALQQPSRTVVRRGDRIDVYNQKPGLCGRLFQSPDFSIVIRK